MMNTHSRGYLFTLRYLSPVIGLLLITLFVTDAQAAVSAVRTSGPTFFSNSDATPLADAPRCNYLSFDMTNDGADIADAWVQIGSFGSYLSTTAGYDDGLFHIGPMASNETVAAFFYVCLSSPVGETMADQYTVTTYNGKPALASSVSQGGTTFNTTNIDSTTDNAIYDGVIEAQANKVVAVWAGTSNDVLGATATLTVDGDTGSIGNFGDSFTKPPYGPLSFSPATAIGWRADANELVKTEIIFSDNTTNAGTYVNTLYIDDLVSSADTHYTATYYFRPVSTTVSGVPLSPVSFIASGTQMKHTALFSEVGSNLPAANVILLAKSVSHATLPAQGGVVTYTLSATNSGSLDVSLDSFIDALPPGAVYVPGSSTFDNDSLLDPYETAAVDPNGATLEWSSYFTIPAGTTVSLIFQATLPATPGTYTNSATALIGSSVIDTTLDSSGVPATASTVVLEAPTISKEFSPTALAIGISSTLTLTIGNTNTAHTLNGIAISDTLPAAPAGLVFATPPDAATTCSGAALNISGTTISITGGTLAAEQSCTVSVKVTSTVNETYINTTDTVSSTNGGTGGTANATITFSPKPTITKAFSVSTIPVDGTATLSFTITNNTDDAITNVTFDDLFPSGLVTANPPALNPASPCGGSFSSWDGALAGTLSATGGDVGIRLTGSGIATAADSCTFSIDVTSATAGDYANTTTSGVVTSESTEGPVSNTATLSVLAPPTVSKAFSPSTMGIGQTSTLTITLTNPNTTAISGAAFTDTYPTDLVTNGTPNATTSCASGSVTSLSGSVSLSGAIIPASGSCTVSVDVTSAIAATYTNILAIGAVTTSNAGSNTLAASATLTVNTSPTVDKSFSFNTSTGIATMSITITNNDAGAIADLTFTDLFPIGMSTDNPPTLTPDPACGASSTLESWDGNTAVALSATGGDLGIKLTAGEIVGAGSCTFSINLVVNTLGVHNNQITDVAGTYSNASTFSGIASNTATWIAPSISKTFTPTQVTPTTLGPSDISRLVLTITNPSLTTSLSGLRISDLFPTEATKLAGGTLRNAPLTTSPTPNGVTTCTGGTVEAWDGTTATSLAGGDPGIIMTGGTLAPGASCSIEVDVYATDTTPATYANTTDNVASEQGIGVTGSDILIITTKPTIEKSFLTSPVSLSSGTATSVMRIIVENNSGTDITDISFSDTFPTSPSQMVWENTVSNDCGGTLTDAADAALVAGTSTSIKLAGGAITSAVPVTCTIDITVSVTAAGSYDNTTTGATSSANDVVGPVSNTAQLVAYLTAPTATKTFASTGFQVDGANRLTITLANSNTEAITSVAFTDTYPTNLVNAATPNLTNTCSGTVTAAAGGGSLSISGGSIPAASGSPLVDGTCTIEVDLTATAAGDYINTLATDAVTSTNAAAGPATDVTASTTAYLPPTLSKTFGLATLSSGSSTTLTLTLTNPNPASITADITNLLVDDTFPSGMTLQDVVFTYTPASCGTVTGTSGAASVIGDDNIRFSVASLASGISCEVSVNITSSTAGAVTNTTNEPVATAPVALTGTTAWASITIQGVPSITLLKSVLTFSDPVNITANPKAIPGAVIQYTIIATNSGDGPADTDSTMLVDPVPANTELYVDDIGGPGPVKFIDGATSSTLSYTFNTFVDMTDDLSFSNDGGTTWTAVPVIGANGCDSTITNIRVNPKGAFVGDSTTPSPSFQVVFRVCIQ